MVRRVSLRVSEEISPRLGTSAWTLLSVSWFRGFPIARTCFHSTAGRLWWFESPLWEFGSRISAKKLAIFQIFLWKWRKWGYGGCLVCVFGVSRDTTQNVCFLTFVQTFIQNVETFVLILVRLERRRRTSRLLWTEGIFTILSCHVFRTVFYKILRFFYQRMPGIFILRGFFVVIGKRLFDMHDNFLKLQLLH